MSGHVLFMDCLRNNLREVYCFEFTSSDFDTSDEVNATHMTDGYRDTHWNKSKDTANKAVKLELIIPMPIAKSGFRVGSYFPTLTIYRRPATQPNLATSDFVSFHDMQVTSQANLQIGRFKVPMAANVKVGKWSGQADSNMYVPTIVLLKKPKT